MRLIDFFDLPPTIPYLGEVAKLPHMANVGPALDYSNVFRLKTLSRSKFEV